MTLAKYVAILGGYIHNCIFVFKLKKNQIFYDPTPFVFFFFFFIDCASCFSSPLQVLGCVTGLQEWWDGETQLLCGCEAMVLGRVYSINKRPAIEYTRQAQGQLSCSHFLFFFLNEILLFQFLMPSGRKPDVYHVKQKALALQS